MYKILLIILWFLVNTAKTQIQITLIPDFSIFINDTLFQPGSGWLDSLREEADNNILLYAIFSANITGRSSTTRIQLSPTLKLDQVLRQIVLYYSFIDEEDRHFEKVLIYPFFSDFSEYPYVEIKFSDNKFYIKYNYWPTIPVPEQPDPREIQIYNKLIQDQFAGKLDFGEFEENKFKNFARRNEISSEEIKRIYKKVILWQYRR